MRPREAPGQGLLAIALIVVELIGGMQVYLGQAVLPVMTSELGGKDLYGAATGAARIAGLAALPVGAALVTRLRIPPLLTVLTGGLVAGAVVSATAGSMPVFALGLVLRSFVGGCLAAVSMGALAVGLQGRWRRIALAFMSGVWIISSIAGPAYAAWAIGALGWRWAMVLYLPLVLAGRWVIALRLRDAGARRGSPVRFIDAIPLAVGLALVALPVGTGPVRGLAMASGVALLVLASVRILPRGTFLLAGPRRAAVATLCLLTGVYFAVDAVVAILAHDVLGAGPAGMGLVLTAGGLAWALLGFGCGLRPACTRRGYLVRVGLGAGLIVAGVAGVAVVVLRQPAGAGGVGVLAACWALAGAGMGLAYVDTLAVIFDEQHAGDGLGQAEAGAAATVAEGIASAVTATLATSFVAVQLTRGVAGRHAIVAGLMGVAIAALLLAAVARGRRAGVSPQRQ